MKIFDLLIPLIAQRPGSFWMPPPRSDTAPAVDAVFHLILGIAAIFFGIIVVSMGWMLLRYRHGRGAAAAEGPTHNTLLEVAWTVIPLILVIVIFYQGFAVYMTMATPPANAYEIEVISRKWDWTFKYPNGHLSPQELHVPAGEAIRLRLTSRDVIHSLSIPVFRVKMDCVPGRYTTAWFRATHPGEYDLYCTEYCGKDHSRMLGRVIVHEPADFERWLEEASDIYRDMPPAEIGRIAYQRHGCQGCHSIDGTASTGPTLLNIWGETHRMRDGTTVEVDANYIRESILEPMARIREGYTGQMPTYKGIIKEEELEGLIAYIRSLGRGEAP